MYGSENFPAIDPKSESQRRGRPTVGVIIPAHNAEQYLPDTLSSIGRQTLAPTQIIVVDDGSSDETAAIAESFGATVIRQARSGVSAARNAAIDVIDTDYVAFCDADDVWLPTKLERQADVLLANPNCDFVFCDYFQFRGDDVVNASVLKEVFGITADSWESAAGSAYVCDRETINRQTLVRSFILPSTFLLRTTLLHSLSGFSTEIGATDEDTEYLLRVFTRSDALYVDEPLMGYRLHAGNATADPRKQRIGLVRLAAHVVINNDRYRSESAQYYRANFSNYLFRAGRIYASCGDTTMGVWFLDRSMGVRFSVEALAWRIIAPLFALGIFRRLAARLRGH